MANVKNYGLSALSTSVEFGKKGQKIVSNGSTFGVYENIGIQLTDLTNLLVKDGAADQDAVAFKQMNTAISTATSQLAAGLVYKGVFNATTPGTLPTPIKQGNFWKVSVAGIIGSLELAIGDMIIANETDTGVTVDTQFDKIDNTEAADILRTVNISATADLSSTVGGINDKLASRGVTATYIDTVETAALVNSVFSRTVALAFDSTSPVNIGAALPANATVVKAYIKVTTAFNGTLPTVCIGYVGATTIVADVTESDLVTLGLYEISALVNFATSKQYIATYVSNTSTIGAATIILQYTNGVI